jgi:uncharacterized protein YutE (UPF0331/DUF86 family)
LINIYIKNMSASDKEFIRQKIKLAEEYLGRMKKYLEADDFTVSTDPKTRDTLERVFLLLVEELIDINNFFIKEYKAKPIDDLKSSFLVFCRRTLRKKFPRLRVSGIY